MTEMHQLEQRDSGRPIPGVLHSENSQLLLIDVQQRLLAAMCDPNAGVRATHLARFARALHVPVWATTQYAAKLGGLIEGLAQHCPQLIDKKSFSAGATPVFDRLQETPGRACVVIAGVEAHVCVLQSALDLKASGFEVYVVADAVSSRSPFDASTALARLAALGVHIVTSEMVMFEWTRSASHPEFKTLQQLIN